MIKAKKEVKKYYLQKVEKKEQNTKQICQKKGRKILK